MPSIGYEKEIISATVHEIAGSTLTTVEKCVRVDVVETRVDGRSPDELECLFRGHRTVGHRYQHAGDEEQIEEARPESMGRWRAGRAVEEGHGRMITVVVSFVERF